MAEWSSIDNKEIWSKSPNSNLQSTIDICRISRASLVAGFCVIGCIIEPMGNNDLCLDEKVSIQQLLCNCPLQRRRLKCLGRRKFYNLEYLNDEYPEVYLKYGLVLITTTWHSIRMDSNFVTKVLLKHKALEWTSKCTRF